MGAPNPATAWPGSAEPSIEVLIKGIRAVGRPADGSGESSNWGRTPYSLQVIKAGATALTKVWVAAVAAAGGVPALIAIIQGITNSLGGKATDTPLVRAAFVLSGSILLSTVAIAIAIIVRGDVAARATSSAARKTGESNIIATALANYEYAAVPAQPSIVTDYLVRKPDGTYLRVKNFNWAGGKLIITTETGDQIEGAAIDALVNVSELEPKP